MTCCMQEGALSAARDETKNAASTVVPVEPALTYPILLDRAAIERLLPHRGEILFARSLRIIDAEHYEGKVSWDGQSVGMAGHFPGCPIVPGVFLIEAVAQMAGAGMLGGNPIARAGANAALGVLGGVRRASFTGVVQAGDVVHMNITGRQIGEGLSQVKALASVDGAQVAAIDVTLVQVPLAVLAAKLPVEALLRGSAGVLGFPSLSAACAV